MNIEHWTRIEYTTTPSFIAPIQSSYNYLLYMVYDPLALGKDIVVICTCPVFTPLHVALRLYASPQHPNRQTYKQRFRVKHMIYADMIYKVIGFFSAPVSMHCLTHSSHLDLSRTRRSRTPKLEPWHLENPTVKKRFITMLCIQDLYLASLPCSPLQVNNPTGSVTHDHAFAPTPI
jgi:hypothetical protein